MKIQIYTCSNRIQPQRHPYVSAPADGSAAGDQKCDEVCMFIKCMMASHLQGKAFISGQFVIGLEFMSVRVCAATVHQISSNQISDNGRLNLSGKSCFRPSTSTWTQPVQIFWDRLLCLLSLCHRETSCQVFVPKRLSWAFLQRLSSCSLLRHVVQPSPSASWCISEPWLIRWVPLSNSPPQLPM